MFCFCFTLSSMSHRFYNVGLTCKVQYLLFFTSKFSYIEGRDIQMFFQVHHFGIIVMLLLIAQKLGFFSFIICLSFHCMICSTIFWNWCSRPFEVLFEFSTLVCIIATWILLELLWTIYCLPLYGFRLLHYPQLYLIQSYSFHVPFCLFLWTALLASHFSVPLQACCWFFREFSRSNLLLLFFGMLQIFLNARFCDI